MAVTATVQVRGLREIDRLLDRLPAAVEDEITFQALQQSGQIILAAAKSNIHSRSGATAADLQLEVQVIPARHQGVAAVGGTRRGTAGRAHVVRWLELGTKPHKIVAGAPGRRDLRRALRALRSVGRPQTAARLRRDIRSGQVGFKRGLKLPGGIFRASAAHPGTRNQSPLTRALAENATAVGKKFREVAWRGIVRFTASMPTVKR